MTYYFSVNGEVYRFLCFTFNHNGKCCVLEEVFNHPKEEKKIEVYTLDYMNEYVFETYLWGE